MYNTEQLIVYSFNLPYFIANIIIHDNKSIHPYSIIEWEMAQYSNLTETFRFSSLANLIIKRYY